MSLTIGSVCSGYGGLDMALMAIFDAEFAWYSDIDDGAIRIMSHHHPDVPNLGDLTTCDWTRVPHVDIFTAGYPCQPFSHAGKRKGADDERHLWPYIREAIRVLRPRLVVLENVAGHRSMGADRVLGDMAEDGLHVRWISVRASDIGAAHKRERWFCLAHPEGESWEQWHRDACRAADTADLGCERDVRARDGWTGPTDSLLPTPTARDWKNAGDPDRYDGRAAEHSQPLSEVAVNALLPTPRATDHHDSMTAPAARSHVADGNGTLPETLGVHLFPTPRASDGEKGGPGQRGSSGDLMLPSAVALLPTPSVADAAGGHESRSGERGDELLLPGLAKSFVLLPTPTATSYDNNRSDNDGAVKRSSLEYVTDWGKYATAIHRHEVAMGRPAPCPVQSSSKGAPQLAPVFTEWLMCLPAGHVTDPVIWEGMTDAKGKPASKAAIRNAQLHALGNGVVPPQAEYAIRTALSWRIPAAAREDQP